MRSAFAKLQEKTGSIGIRIGDTKHLSTGTESFRYDPNRTQLKYGSELYDKLANDVQAAKLDFDPKLYEFQDWCPVYPIGKTPSGGNVFFSSITSSIDLIHEYVVLLNTLYEATDADIIELNIDSPGGYIATATQICTAIRNCKGQVLTHASGICASAGSLIWSVGHEVSIGDTANFMWHMSSHADWGNSITIRDEADFQINYVRDILLNISLTRGFITEEEIAKICDNPDDAIWVSAKTMRERLASKIKEGIVSPETDQSTQL